MAEQVTRRPFTREVSRTRWFFRQPRYLRYMAREVTCIFIAIYTVILVIGCVRLAQGREAYEQFLAALGTPSSIAFHLLALIFALYHSFTWFNLAPKALPMHIGDKTVPAAAIAGAHYVGWIVISLGLLLIAGAF
jgi:succinate dehydrogenase subunit C